MSRIYVVTDRLAGDAQYVRAKNLNAAIRAVAHKCFIAKAATSDEVFQAMKEKVDVLDAVGEDGAAEEAA